MTTSTPPDAPGDDRGREADIPTDVPPRGWKDVLVRVRAESRRDRVSLLAGGVAFFALLAIVPALVALVSIYGLVVDPDQVEQQVVDVLDHAPEEVRDLVSEQLSSIATSGEGTAVLGVIGGIALAMWSASSGMSHLIEAINAAYDEGEDRGFVKKRGLSLLLTVGAVVFLTLALAVIALVPALIEGAGFGVVGGVLIWTSRWVFLLVAMTIALATLYRCAPDRDAPKWTWTSPGAVVTTVVWVVVSALFSLYVSNFGSYNETYGSLGAVVVLMLWLQLTAMLVILGAELNSELERQTRHDTTRGPSEPLGQRHAYAADTVGQTSEQLERAAQQSNGAE